MYRWEKFEVGDQIWFRIDKVYCPKGKPNKCEMLRWQGPYTVIGKISLLIYRLDISVYTKIYFVIFMVYLLQYRIYEDPFYRVLLSFGLVECGLDSDTLVDEV